MHASILGSFVLRRGGRYRGASRLQYHVLRIPSIANSGFFHTKTSLNAKELLGKKSTKRGTSNSIKGGPNRFFMITSSRPGVTKYRDILDELSNLLSTSTVKATQSRNPAVVILATPTFATWLEDGAFMREVLETIFSTKETAEEGPILDVTALVAVVDGLPSEKYEEVGQVTEGFAFLRCNQKIAIPGLWMHNDKTATEYQSNLPKSSITFRMHTKSSGNRSLDISVPLTKTMFRNGRTFTLLASKWNRHNGIDMFEKIEQVEKKSVTVRPDLSDITVPLHLEIPLIPLTPLRQVVSGLGNILRQVANAEGKAVSASQELEASVDSYLEVRSLDKQRITVWALVVPNAVVMKRTGEGIPAADSEQIRHLWTNTLDPSINSCGGHWLLGGGSSLHRVLSGGGGWGPKQGLLSLDPETKLWSSRHKSHNLDSSDSSDDDQIKALGDIAKPGSWVQFLTSQNITSSRPISNADLGNAGSGLESADYLYFGCIASTVDHIPQPLSDPSAPSDNRSIQSATNGYHGKFGAMSEAGIFIRARNRRGGTSSKIDVPNSEFRLAVIGREESFKRAGDK